VRVFERATESVSVFCVRESERESTIGNGGPLVSLLMVEGTEEERVGRETGKE
jgi:hypothetical protein